MRLIDADAFLKDILTAGIGKTIIEYSEIDIGYMIRRRPTIDAVPVIRCKDCKWLYSEMGNYCCRSHRGLVRICENSFCSYGERKDGDENG